MAADKKAETKNQHYVPQFYQRMFSGDVNHKTIGAYIISSRKYIPAAPIKNQSSGDYFYSDNQKIEDALGKMEELASEVIKKIKTNPKCRLSTREEYILYCFTFIQIGRTLDRANFIQESVNQVAKTMLKKYVELKRTTDEAAEVECITDEIVDTIKVNLNKPAMFSLGQHVQLINTCIDLKLKVIINNTRMPFVTSDNPACMYSMFLERVGEPIYALGSKGLIFYIPLSSDIALLFYDSLCYKVGDRKKSYVEITQQEDAVQLNHLSACYANEVLYCLDGSISKYELEKLVDIHDKYRPLQRVQSVEGVKHPNGEIIGTVTKSIYCHLKLSFVKEPPLVKAITKNSYNPSRDRLRPIAYIKDDLIIKPKK